MDPIVRFLGRYTTVAGEIGAGLGFKQTKIISSAINLLFESAKAVTTSYDQVEELLHRISEIVLRVQMYCPDNLDPQLCDVLVEELCHMLRILGIATKGVHRSKTFYNALANQNNDISSALAKLKDLLEKEKWIVQALTYCTVGDIHRILQPSAENKSDETTPQQIALPSPSAFFLGRDAETSLIIKSVLRFESSVIYGPGGIGKTSLSLQVLHDEQVCRHFVGRYFVRCEGTTTLDLLYTEIVDSCGIRIAQRDQTQLKERILDSIRDIPTMLCFDNFETLWDIEQTRHDVEQALKSFVDLPTTSVLVTMRGSREPGSIPWSYPLSRSLQPLAPTDAFALFREHSRCNENDPYAHRLVEAMESIPLAVVLLAYQARGEDETTEELWHRLEKYGTSVVSRGQSGGRHLDLNTSIELSLNGPRIRVSPLARHTLALLSLLPGGLDRNGVILEELCRLGEFSGLSDSLRLLSDTALTFIDSSLDGRRYRILAPISRFSRQHLLPFLPETIQKRVVYIYTQFMRQHSPATPEHHKTVPSELANSHSMLQFALDGKLVAMPELVKGILSQTDWMTWLGSPSADLLLLAIRDGTIDQDNRGDCLRLLGSVYLQQNRLYEAEASIMAAVKLHRQAHSVLGEGNDRTRLAEVYLRQDRLKEVEESLISAIKLHQQARGVLGEGNDRGRLGELYLRQNRLEEAEVALLDALKLHRLARSVLGEGTDREMLAELYLRQGRLEEAESSLIAAIKLHQQAHSILGEGNSRKTLAELYFRQDRLKEAEASLIDAIKLHQHAHSVLGEGNDRGRLGELYLRQDRPAEAEVALLDALKLHRRAHSVLGEGSDRKLLAELYLRQDRLEEAEAFLIDAIKLHQQAHSVLGEGNDRGRLGELYLRQNRLDEAETALLDASTLHQQAHSAVGKGSDKKLLAELYLRQGRLEEAESSLIDAIKLHGQAHSVLSEGNSRKTLGELYLRQDRLNEAEESFLGAIKLHQQTHSVLGEGNDRAWLGELYLRQDRLKEAEESLLDAVTLHRKSHSVLGEGSDIARLGEIYLRQDRLQEAEASLLDAIKLHQRAHSILGEGKDKGRLGELYLRQNLFEKAETSLLDAVELRHQAHDVVGEGIDRKTLGELYLRQDRLKEAEVSLLQAVSLHEKAKDDSRVEDDRSLLEELYKRQGWLGDAKRPVQEDGPSDSDSIATSTTDEQYLSCNSE